MSRIWKSIVVTLVVAVFLLAGGLAIAYRKLAAEPDRSAAEQRIATLRAELAGVRSDLARVRSDLGHGLDQLGHIGANVGGDVLEVPDVSANGLPLERRIALLERRLDCSAKNLAAIENALTVLNPLPQAALRGQLLVCN